MVRRRDTREKYSRRIALRDRRDTWNQGLQVALITLGMPVARLRDPAAMEQQCVDNGRCCGLGSAS